LELGLGNEAGRLGGFPGSLIGADEHCRVSLTVAPEEALSVDPGNLVPADGRPLVRHASPGDAKDSGDLDGRKKMLGSCSDA
jgi:hypothetical protein